MVVPSSVFSAPAVLSALVDEKCTALHGVPAMFEELLSTPRPEEWKIKGLRTGIIAGAPVPRPLMERLVNELGMREFTSSYGLTEASPTCFNAENNESVDLKLTTVGKIMPHLHAKIVDRDGRIVKLGEKGELCISGYSIMKGYWRNKIKTREAVRSDASGVEWLFTGDEALFLEGGYCRITGRFKDIIIRGEFLPTLMFIRFLLSLENNAESLCFQEAKTFTLSKSSLVSFLTLQVISYEPQ